MDTAIKVAILDDERHIIRLIQALVPWDELGLEFVGAAENGMDGQELIRAAKPDIVITDIKMPGMDGIELIRSIHGEFPDTNFIIISGYRQFDYAKQAMAYGVDNYLLKPIDRNELVDTLLRIRKEKFARRKTADMIRESEQEHADRSFVELLNGNDVSNFPVEEGGCNILMLLKIDFMESAVPKEMLNVADGKLVATIRKQKNVKALFVDKDMIFFLCVLDEGGEKEFFASLSFSLKAFSGLFPGMKLSLFHIHVDGHETFPAALRSLKGAVSLRYQVDDVRPIEVSRESPYREGFQFAAWEKAADKMIASLDAQCIADGLDELEKELRGTGCDPYLVVSHAANRLSVKLEERYGCGFQWLAKTADGLRMAPDVDSLYLRFREAVMTELSHISMQKRQETSKPIREAKAYIGAHYMDYDISLETVAGHVGLSPSYFCQLFRKEEKVGFQEALTEIRLQKAKELLQDSKCTVYEVAAKIGYGDVKYFARIFKKQFGIKPNEYRRLYG